MASIKNWLFGLFHISEKRKTTEQIFFDVDELTKSLLYRNENDLQKFFKNN